MKLMIIECALQLSRNFNLWEDNSQRGGVFTALEEYLVI